MIKSFEIDHTKLNPGLYVSRVDKLGAEEITTFDIRVCKPNKDMMTSAAAHTIEHLMADYLRNDSKLKEVVLYFGPMGCLTGFYLILMGHWESKQIKPDIVNAFQICSESKVIPGATEMECGNYRLNDLNVAIKICQRYADYLASTNDDGLIYPI